ncbi:prepilin peptidase [bacterium]|nr:prepilin peptidase [bacterium]
MLMLKYFFIFLLGLCIGSFLNVLIDRLSKRESILGRSYCPYCKRTLRWYELIPVLSFVFLRGRCRGCKKRISLQYPLVELTTGVLFTATVYYLNLTDKGLVFDISHLISLVCLLFIISCLIVIFMTDLKYMIVPDEIIYPAIVSGIVYQVINWRMARLENWYYPLLAGVVPFLFFLFLVLVTKGKGMGFGDVKIALFMGIFLSWPNILVALSLAFFSGAIIGLILVALKKKGLKSEIPFACFLAPATLVTLFWGEQIVEWYLGII